MAIPTVNEKSGQRATAWFFEEPSGKPAAPTTVHYRIDCESTQKTLIDFTPLTPVRVPDDVGLAEVYVTIPVPSTVNAIQDNANARELKKILVVADMDTETEYSQEFPYYVRNLRGRS